MGRLTKMLDAEWQRSHRRDLLDRRSSGMTLFEILLVLILLVVLGSLATPLLESTFASVRLRRATDQVLSAWTEVRTRAIEDGEVYQFRFAEDSSEYRVDPWYADESYQGSDRGGTDSESEASRRTTDSENDSDEEDWRYEASLTETITFTGGQRAVFDESGSKEVQTMEGEEPANWSAPILFFPDGTTSEASILLRNENDRYQRATLRSLTGAARASELLSGDAVSEESTR